jgi:hypothetical protein
MTGFMYQDTTGIVAHVFCIYMNIFFFHFIIFMTYFDSLFCLLMLLMFTFIKSSASHFYHIKSKGNYNLQCVSWILVIAIFVQLCQHIVFSFILIKKHCSSSINMYFIWHVRKILHFTVQKLICLMWFILIFSWFRHSTFYLVSFICWRSCHKIRGGLHQPISRLTSCGPIRFVYELLI